MSRIDVEYPGLGDADAIKAIQDSWLGARVGSEGFLLSPESLDRLREIIESRNILVAQRGDEIVSYLTFYRRADWELRHPGYTANLEWESEELREFHVDADYVVIDHIARRRSYSGDAAVRLVIHLKGLLRDWNVGRFMGEISPDNQRSAAFFSKTLRAKHSASTVRDGIPWDIYTAPV